MDRSRPLLRIATVILGAGAASLFFWRGFSGAPAPSLEEIDLGAVSDFHLVERSGRPVGLSDLKGKVWVADFVFTRCMGPCPLLSRTMKDLQESLPGVSLVSFTVDPVHDTPAVLADYAEKFGADKDRWFFLTGDVAAIHALVLGSFKSALQENGPSRPGEEVTHSLHFVLVDKAGRIRGYFNATEPEALERLRERARALQ